MSGTLLIVDDERDVRVMLRLVLEAQGWTVEEAVSGEDALDRCRRQPAPEVVILDQRMPPGLTGIDVVKTLQDEGLALPIALYSAHLPPDVEAEAKDTGVTLVAKGELQALVKTVRSLAEGKRPNGGEG